MDDETISSIILNRFLGPILRTGTAGFLALLSAHGFTFDASLGNDFVKAILPLLAVLAASIYQKFQAAKVTKAALSLPAGSSLSQAKDKAANS